MSRWAVKMRARLASAAAARSVPAAPRSCPAPGKAPTAGPAPKNSSAAPPAAPPSASELRALVGDPNRIRPATRGTSWRSASDEDELVLVRAVEGGLFDECVRMSPRKPWTTEEADAKKAERIATRLLGKPARPWWFRRSTRALGSAFWQTGHENRRCAECVRRRPRLRNADRRHDVVQCRGCARSVCRHLARPVPQGLFLPSEVPACALCEEGSK